MRLPIIASLLVARQAVELLPSTYCAPECPLCKSDIGVFDGATTSCTPNSSFIQNCGHCQSCVEVYAIDNGGITSLGDIEGALSNILNYCANVSAVSADIQALQSQASRLSALGAELATTTDPALASLTGTMTMTDAPSRTSSSEPAWMTITGDVTDPSFASVLATATWASYYYSHVSAESASLASVVAQSTSSPKPTQSSTPAPLSPTWIAGPVIGSVMGICTVITVIFFTRRKQQKEDDKRRDAIKMVEIEKPMFHDHDDNESATSPAPPEKAQLHAESAPPPDPPAEVEVHEVHELPAVEPVGSELSTPMEVRMRDDWPVSPMGPMPLSPLPLLFAMTEMRDQRNGVGDVSPKHDTFYHP